MDHRTFLRSLSADERRSLTARSDVIGLCHLAVHVGLIGICTGLILLQVPFWPLLMPLQGVLLVFLFTLMHEAAHQTPFRSRWISRCVSHMCGVILFLPANWFRYFHLAHHRFTQDPDRDPELSSPRPSTRWQYLRHVSGLPIYAFHVQTLIRNARGQGNASYVPVSKRRLIAWESRAMLLLYCLLFAATVSSGFDSILYIWIIPLVIGQPFLRLYLLAEHVGCPAVSDMFANTRTVRTTWFVRKLAWNMPYHAEHHAYPTVPFYRLGDLHRMTREHLRATETGYIAFNRQFFTRLNW